MNQQSPNPPEFAQPRLSRSNSSHPQREGTNLGVCLFLYGWYCPGARLQIRCGCVCSVSFRPAQTWLCKFGWVWSSLNDPFPLRLPLLYNPPSLEGYFQGGGGGGTEFGPVWRFQRRGALAGERRRKGERMGPGKGKSMGREGTSALMSSSSRHKIADQGIPEKGWRRGRSGRGSKVLTGVERSKNPRCFGWFSFVFT